MAASHPDPAAVLRDARWLPHRYDANTDAVQFRYVSRDQHRTATFLTDDNLGPGPISAIARATAMAQPRQQAPVHFIFHSAFCCSTLMARAFDIEAVAMVLKEPVILNDISGWKRRGGVAQSLLAEVLNDAMALLARPFQPGEAVVIKPSNVINAYIPAMLSMRPAAKVLLMVAPLHVFLGSIVRKGMWGRIWVRDLLVKLLADDIVDLGFAHDDYLKLTDLQVAAVGWLAQHALFGKVIEHFGAARVRTIDSESLLDRSEAAVAATAALFDLKVDAGAVAAGPAFTSNSKNGQPFTRAERDAGRIAQEAPHRDELDKIAVWARAVAENAGIALKLPGQLLV